VIRDGNKIFLIEIEEIGIKFLRSNNYFQGNEQELALLFDIKHQKQFFPNRFPDVNYIGTIPNAEFFFEFKDTKLNQNEKLEFISSFKNNKKSWNFKKELLEFSEEKLRIVTLAFLKFIEESFILQKHLQTDQANTFGIIHPLANNVSSTSAFIYKVLKLFYLNKYSICSIKNEFGISFGKQISTEEYEYSCFLEFEHPQLNYRSAFNHELSQKTFKECIPDIYSPVTLEAIFFNGCFYHAHMHDCLLNPKASPTTIHPLYKKSYQEINNDFEKKIALLLLNNPNEVKSIKIMWECNYLKERNSNPLLKQFLSNNFKERPFYRLRPRTATRSSFTECFALKWLKSQNPSEKFYCLDFNAMYSYIAMTFKFAIGDYKILVGNNLNKIKFLNNQYCFENNSYPMVGVMLVKVTPPKSLLFPFLALRLEDESTVFTLCSKCAESKNQFECCHSDLERSFTSVYFISELNFATTLGYEINEIFECHYFESSDFILKDFVKKLSCLRLQNSDLLTKFHSEEQKQQYCNYLNESLNLEEPFKLKVENIKPNNSKKLFYKTMMNSIFGKLQQRSDKPKTVYVNCQEELEKYYFSDSIISNIFCLNENVCELEIKMNSEKIPPNRESNSYIGGELVSYGRILMYQTIQKVNSIGKVFYSDCDSCFFSLPSSVPLPFEISDVFGAFKHVFPGEIQSFYCIAAKNYAVSYKTEENVIKQVTKIKGISLSTCFDNTDVNISTFDLLMTNYLKNEIKKIDLVQLKCRKEKKSRKIFRKLEVVQLSNQITNRRVIVKNCMYLSTVPYGFSIE